MLAFAYYLLKVSSCSCLLYGYYFVALRNKRFHQYNRFYLIFAVLLSWVIPLAKIEFWNGTVQHDMPAIELLKVVATRDALLEESLKSIFGIFDYNLVALVIFSLVSAVLFSRLITGIVKIAILIKTNPGKRWNNIHFIITEAKGTPFSFFKYIFWNKNTNLETEEGKCILRHELTHVHEKYSADKLFLHIVLIIAWLNPFFWVIRKELDMIHEFIADEKAINDGDAELFSAMLLKTIYPQQYFMLTNSFFHSPIKRRLIMFTTSKKPSYSYLRRLMVLPLLSFVIVFFSFKTKRQNSYKSPNVSATISASKKVVINESKENKTRDEGVDTTVEMTDQNAHTVIAFNKTGINIKTYNVDTPAILNALVVVNGVQMSSKDFNIKDIAPEQIEEIRVLKGIEANKKYGEKGANGVIEVTTKDFIKTEGKENHKKEESKTVSSMNNPDTTYATFPGGVEAWKSYLEKNLNANVPVLKDKAPKGIYTVKVQFVVTETGDIKNVSAMQLPARCPSCAIEAVRIIKTGPNWEPMAIAGKNVPSEQIQFISFQVDK